MGRLPSRPSHAVDLAELSVFSGEDVERAARGRLLGAVAGAQAFRRMVAWRSARRGRPTECEPCDPPAGVAFPVACGDAGTRAGVAWVDAVPLSSGKRATGSVDASVLVGFELARGWLSDRVADAAGLVPHLRVPGEIAGGSGGLASFVACLGRGLGLPLPDDLAATGGFTVDEHGPRIRPVSTSTIRRKVQVLHEHGFRRVLVPASQQELIASVAPSDVAILGVAEDARATLPELLGLLVDEVHDEGPLLACLLTIDRVCVRSPHGVEQAFPRALLAALHRHATPTVRVVVADLLARRATHLGRPVAQRLARHARAGMTRHPPRVADPWLADYFDAHHLASRAVLALDAGDWNEDGTSAAWRDVDEELLELDRRRARREGRFVSVRDEYARFALLNTRAFRYAFLGRLTGDRGLVRRALDDRLALRQDWDALVRYGRSLGHEDATLRRQHNYVLDSAAAWVELGGAISELADVTDPIDASGPSGDVAALVTWDGPERDLAFLAYHRMRWLRARGEAAWERLASEWMARVTKRRDVEPWAFPHHLPVEQVAAFHSDASLRGEAARWLDERPWTDRFDDPQAMLWVLRFRAIAAAGIGRGEDRSHVVEQRLVKGRGALGEIARRMREDILRRCPY